MNKTGIRGSKVLPPIQLVLEQSPTWQKGIQQSFEAGIMSGFQQMKHFMNNDVLQEFRGFFGQLGIEADVAGNRVAASPSGLHPLDEKPVHAHSHKWLPFLDQGGQGLLHLTSIPAFHQRLSPSLIGARTHPQAYPVVFQFDGGRPVALGHRERVAFPPHAMILALQILTRAVAILAARSALLFPDPPQLGNGKEADILRAHPGRRRNAHAAGGQMDAQVDILDGLECHLHRDVAKFELPGHQSSFN